MHEQLPNFRPSGRDGSGRRFYSNHTGETHFNQPLAKCAVPRADIDGDEIGAGVDGLATGDRIFGGAMAKAAADFLVLKSPTLPPDAVFHTPDGVSDEVASTLAVAGLTAAAARTTRLPPPACVIAAVAVTAVARAAL